MADLVKRTIHGSVIDIIRNDDLSIEELKCRLPYYSAVIVGPGPGSPANEKDIGVIKHLWHLNSDHLLPIFGVCLGFQSLALEFGANLRRLKIVKHGQISRLIHKHQNLYENLGHVDVVRYHSLHVSLEDSSSANLDRLAWTNDKEDNGIVLMAVAHKSRPFWGVQYHPESICSTHGVEIISNFWKFAESWSRVRIRSMPAPHPIHPHLNSWPAVKWAITRDLASERTNERPALVLTEVIDSFFVPAPVVHERLNDIGGDHHSALLDSASDPGRFSIIPCSLSTSQFISFKAGDDYLESRDPKSTKRLELGGSTIWEWLRNFMFSKRASHGSPHSPFWGGLVGMLSYELGAQLLVPGANEPAQDDLLMIFVERSIVLDTKNGLAYVQSIVPNDHAWIEGCCKVLKTTLHSYRQASQYVPISVTPKDVKLPEKLQYISKVQQAQHFLESGDSYELCLTARTHVTLQALPSPANQRARSWSLYKRLRERNRAPFSCYFRLRNTTMLGSSPERFLSFTRDGTCQLRPIKGTASKELCPSRQEAEVALSVPKEFAENLMIVDLIRHDLYGITGTDVLVRKLCSVEEYATVWQLVSVIEGQTVPGSGPLVLGAVLPPGSMTGAPKKRSVEILDELEGDKRGMYSGVCGYFDVGGGGDFSVIIRSCIHRPQEISSQPAGDEVWEIGAGGAITALSDPESEWEEMLVKLRSALSIFDVKAKD